MRTKALILTAALSVTGVASSMAQVYSQNAVGYYTLTLAEGFNLKANQLNNGDNSIGTVLPVVPDGSQVLKWNFADQTFFDADLYFGDGMGGGEWLNGGSGLASTTVLNPGEGFFINVPEATSVVVVGEVPQGDLNVSVAGAGFALISQPTPQQLALDAAGDAVPASDGDQILFYNAATQGYNDAILFFGDGMGGGEWLDGGTGNPVNPTPGVGDGFFYNSTGAFSWTRTFSVN